MVADNVDHPAFANWRSCLPPRFADIWGPYDTTYPTGRGQTASVSGWQCPGCGSCYSPFVSACWHCGPKTVTATGVNQPAEMGDWGQEDEP